VDEALPILVKTIFTIEVQFALKGCLLTTCIFDVDVEGHP
jgi:hypothetical protein